MAVGDIPREGGGWGVRVGRGGGGGHKPVSSMDHCELCQPDTDERLFLHLESYGIKHPYSSKQGNKQNLAVWGVVLVIEL